MKKYKVYIIVSLLVVLQIVSLIKISNLENQLENTQSNLSNRIESVSGNVNSIYANIDEMLNKQASIIESAHFKMGKLNVSDLTVPITFAVTPKEVSKNTAVSLNFEGEQFSMEKNGTTYIAIIYRNIFDDAIPKVIIDENGVLKTEQPERLDIRNIKRKFIPELETTFLGQSVYGDDSYSKSGTLIIDKVSPSIDAQFNEVRLVIKVDDKVISDKVISTTENSSKWEKYEYEVDEEIALVNGQTCTMTVIATDKFGLSHHKIVDYWKANSDEFMKDRCIDKEIIYSAEGELLWKPDYY